MMTVKEITELLQENPEVSAYEVREIQNEGKQLFYVMGKLETGRSVEDREVSVTVYHDFEEYRGSSSFRILISDTIETVKSKIAEGVKKAKQVKNPFYPLPKKSINVKKEKELPFSLAEACRNAADEIAQSEAGEAATLNATEIFADRNQVRFVSSEGMDHSYEEVKLFVESIPSFSNANGDFELYYSDRFGSLTDLHLKEALKEQLENVQYRANAKTLKDIPLKKDIPVVISGDMLNMLMGNFAEELSYGSQYLKMNHYSIGDTISPIPFDLVMHGEYEGALYSSPIDAHGIVLQSTKIVDQGKAVALWGDMKYGYYMKQENITGSYLVLVMENCPSEDELLKGEHIEILNFSAPQLDESSGYFGGEVRLALYKNGDTIIPLSGFSISGNIYEEIRDAAYSSETAFVNDGRFSFFGPKYMILRHMTLH